MRQLLYLLTALIVALFAQKIVATADVLAPHILRDSLILMAVAATLFAYFATFNQPLLQRHGTARWRTAQSLVLSTGIICALVAGGFFALGEQGTTLSTLRLVLWLLGIVLFILGVSWKARSDAKDAPLYRWQKDADGNRERVPFERAAKSALTAEDLEEAEKDSTLALSATAPESREALDRTQAFVLLNALIALATLLRMWAMRSLPPDCMAQECANILRITEVTSFDALLGLKAPLFDRLAWLFMQITPADQQPLRLASALISIITIPLFYRFARQVSGRAGSLLATALLLLSPWFLWAGNSGNWLIMAPFWLSLCGWLLLRAYGTSSIAAWALAGIAFGAALTDATLWPLSLPAWVFIAWIITASAVALLLHPLPLKGRVRHVGWLLWSFSLAVIPAGAGFSTTSSIADADTGTVQFLPSLIATNIRPLFEQLWWRGDFGPVGTLDGQSMLGWLGAALVFLGLGILIRFARSPSALFLLLSIVLFGATVAGYGGSDSGEVIAWADLLLLLLPFLFILSAVALDQLLNSLLRTWQPLVPPYRLALASLVILLVVSIPTVTDALDAFGAVNIGTENATDRAIGRYLLRELQGNAAEGRTYFVPPTTLASPSVRTLTGDLLAQAVAQQRVRAFDLASDLLFTDATMGDLIYLTPLQNRPLLDLLTQVYPNAEATPGFDDEGEEVLFVATHVPVEILRQNIGLRTFFFAEGTLNEPEKATQSEMSGSLIFHWASQPPLREPFGALLQGTLLVPDAGNYLLRIESGENSGEDATITLLLDQAVVLDTAVNLIEIERPLAKGAYAIEIRYRSASPTDFSINWQPPNGVLQPIPQTALRGTSAPTSGLMGIYYSGSYQQGAELLRQKDLIVGLGVDLPAPYSVRWQGRVAAPRAGEYMFGALAAGDLRMRVDGHTLVDSAVAGSTDALDEAVDSIASEALQEYAEGLLYLNRGWHTIEIEYTPDLERDTQADEATLQLFWQPAGGNPDALPMRYLSPLLVALPSGEVALPPAPPLAAGWLGDENFALSQVPPIRKPQFTIPLSASLQNLPRFIPDLLWKVENGCGPAEEQLSQPRGVAIDVATGLLYVADTGNQRVVAYDLNGIMDRVFQSELFEEPFDVEILHLEGAEGTPLVLDAVSQQILRIDLNVNLSTDTDEESVQPLPLQSGFYRPRGFALDLAGNLLVADTGGARMVMMNTQGQLLAEFGGSETNFGKGQPVDLLSAAGRIWAVTAEDGRLWRLEGDVAQSGSIAAVQPSNTFDAPHLADLPDGSFFLTDPAQHTIRYFAATGEPVSHFAFPDLFQVPVGIDAVEIDGRVHLAVTDSAACTLSFWQLP